MVARPYVFHSPSAKEPSPIPELMVGISHLIWSALISDFPLNHPTARKTVPFGLLSPTAHVAVTSTAASTTAATCPHLLMIRMTLLPPLPLDACTRQR